MVQAPNVRVSVRSCKPSTQGHKALALPAAVYLELLCCHHLGGARCVINGFLHNIEFTQIGISLCKSLQRQNTSTVQKQNTSTVQTASTTANICCWGDA
jgi:hypothetical protein